MNADASYEAVATSLSHETMQAIDHWLTKFPADKKRSALIQSLMAAQVQNGGWLNAETIAPGNFAIGKNRRPTVRYAQLRHGRSHHRRFRSPFAKRDSHGKARHIRTDDSRRNYVSKEHESRRLNNVHQSDPTNAQAKCFRFWHRQL